MMIAERIAHYASSWPVLALSLVAALAAKRLLTASQLRRRMPPGPPGIPFLGNALQMPTVFPWLQFTEWKEQYGPIFSLDLAGQPVVVVNTHKAVGDLFDRRSAIYSDRPRLIMASEMLTGGIFMVFACYGEVWRKMRRACNEDFSIRACEQYLPDLYKEAALNVLEVMRSPDNWLNLLKRTTANGILSAVYGWPRLAENDKRAPIVARIHAHTQHIAASVVPGAFLVEIFPWMTYIPATLAPWKRDAFAWHARETEMFESLNEDVAQNTKKGESPPCFVQSLNADEQRHGLSKKESAWLAGIMFSAGAETTLGTLENFVLAMVLYPDVQKRAQAELDTVIGRDRLPTFEDKDSLPYLRAMVKETLRWRPVGPLAVPRRTMQDDFYEGYFIPKGTTVIPNVWAMNNDRDVFSNPEVYQPDRFIDADGVSEVVPLDTHGMGHVTFGFGRRICAGYHFANQVLFIQMAMLLWAFNIEPPCDAEGKPVLPDANASVDAGVVVLPKPFDAVFKPRSGDVGSVVDHELESVGVNVGSVI